jgi:hypothetical protein
MLDQEKLFEKTEEAYTQLEKATKDYEIASNDLAEFKFEVETTKAVLINAGEITGKNQAERDANLMERMADYYTDLRRLEAEQAMYYMTRKLAEIRVDKYRTLLRIVELPA